MKEEVWTGKEGGEGSECGVEEGDLEDYCARKRGEKWNIL